MFSGITPQEAQHLLQNFGQALNSLNQNVINPVDSTGQPLPGIPLSDKSCIPGIMHALTSIAYHQPFNPIPIDLGYTGVPPSIISNDPKEYLDKLVSGSLSYIFDAMIRRYGQNNQTQFLINFKKSYIDIANKHVFSHQPPTPPDSKFVGTSSSSHPKEKGISYTQDGRDYRLHFQVPHNNLNQAQNIINEMQKQNLPVSIKGNTVTVGSSRGVGYCGAYGTITDAEGNTSINIQFKDSQQRETFRYLVNIGNQEWIPSNKLSFNASHLEKTDKPTPKHVSDTQQKPTHTQTARKEQAHQQLHPQFDENEQMKRNIAACMKTHGNLNPGSWKPLSTKWEFGHSKYSGNFAISSKKYQFELDKQNNILVLDKDNKFMKLTGPHRDSVLNSALEELEKIMVPLIPKIQAQITTYETNIRDNPKDQEKINIWKDKIGILKEAITHLRGDNIDLDDLAKNRFPLSTAGDGIIMKSETTKLLNEVKEFKPYHPSRQFRR